MNKNIQESWVKELESGKYKKTTKVLHRDKRYCCLGVLCQIYKDLVEPNNSSIGWVNDSANIINEGKVRKVYIKRFHLEGYDTKTILPIPIQEWAGLNHFHICQLTSLNDKSKTFTQVIDYIKKL